MLIVSSATISREVGFEGAEYDGSRDTGSEGMCFKMIVSTEAADAVGVIRERALEPLEFGFDGE